MLPKKAWTIPSLVLRALLFALMGVAGCAGLAAPAWDDFLFWDDFSTLGAGWTTLRDASGITDYDQGGYRIQVLQPQTEFWSTPGLDVQDVIVEVEALTLSGPTENLFGLICRYQDNRNFYYLLVGNDGFFIIGKHKDGNEASLGADAFGYHPAIQNDPYTPITLRADCVEDSLGLFVNGELIAQVMDGEFPSGDVGLMAGTFDESGTDIWFDNFTVRRP